MNIRNKNIVVVLCISVLMLTMLSLSCKKKSEPVAPAEIKHVVSETIEQKTCPVMGLLFKLR